MSLSSFSALIRFSLAPVSTKASVSLVIFRCHSNVLHHSSISVKNNACPLPLNYLIISWWKKGFDYYIPRRWNYFVWKESCPKGMLCWHPSPSSHEEAVRVWQALYLTESRINHKSMSGWSTLPEPPPPVVVDTKACTVRAWCCREHFSARLETPFCLFSGGVSYYRGQPSFVSISFILNSFKGMM